MVTEITIQPRTYVAHRDGKVTDRKTGRYMGTVGQHVDYGGEFANRWSAWAPWRPKVPVSTKHLHGFHEQAWDCALGGTVSETRHDAIFELYCPEQLEPVTYTKKCPRCQPVLGGQRCDNCEREDEARSRARRAQPTWWEHYDWLLERQADERLAHVAWMLREGGGRFL